VATASGSVELSEGTAAELGKRLGLLEATRPAAAALGDGGPAPVELDDAARRSVFAELTYWLDSVGPGRFPDDARRLFRALAGELVPTSGL
jgi:hypothetical protein